MNLIMQTTTTRTTGRAFNEKEKQASLQSRVEQEKKNR